MSVTGAIWIHKRRKIIQAFLYNNAISPESAVTPGSIKCDSFGDSIVISHLMNEGVLIYTELGKYYINESKTE